MGQIWLGVRSMETPKVKDDKEVCMKGSRIHTLLDKLFRKY